MTIWAGGGLLNWDKNKLITYIIVQEGKGKTVELLTSKTITNILKLIQRKIQISQNIKKR